MKRLVKKVKSLIICDFPIQAEYISAQFASTHQQFQADIPEWNTEATRQKLIAHYWFSYVPGHFAILIGLPLILVLIGQPLIQSSFGIVSVLISVLLSYSILHFFVYRMDFSDVFLPRLETAKGAFDRQQMEKLEKCRQAQLSNFALTLFFYVLTETNSTRGLKCDDDSANLLMKLYGVDPGSLKKNLELIFVASKRKNFSERRITEIRNRFNETYHFLDELNYVEGIEKLRELEAKFFN